MIIPRERPGATGLRTGTEATMRIHLVYDAWNRLAEARADDGGSRGTTIATYRYDGLGRRIRKLILETWKNADGDPFEQYAWHISYIDAPLVRWHDGDTDGTVDDTLWPTRDANFNVTGLFDGSGTVVTRYVYNPYGRRIKTYDDENEYEWALGHQGQMHDTETNLVYNRARMLHTTLGRFLQRDPVKYGDGMNLYQYADGKPLMTVDPEGLGGFVVGGPVTPTKSDAASGGIGPRRAATHWPYRDFRAETGYCGTVRGVMGDTGLEPVTSRV